MPGHDPLCGEAAGQRPHRNENGRGAARFAVLLPVLACSWLAARIAAAAETNGAAAATETISFKTIEVIQLSIFAGVMGAALLSAIWLIRERGRTAAQNEELKARVAELSGALSRTEALLNLKDQRLLVWSGSGRPALLGELPDDSGAPRERSTFLAFGRWLMPKSAAALDKAAAALRDTGAGFDLVVETQKGILLEVQGRKSALHSVIRFVSLTAAQTEHARLKLEHERIVADYQGILGLINALDMPFWLRDERGQLKWVNAAYARAVEAESAEAATRESREFLPTAARAALQRHHLNEPVFRDAFSTVVEGDRRVFAITNYAEANRSAGIAVDRSEIEALRREYESTLRSHSDTLDQLTTAVAIFDADQKLKFYNQAFQKLWGLDPAFLESGPENALLLDRLRSENKLAEQPEWRRWKEQLLSAYRSVEAQEHWWHLPDGRTIRVVASPQAKGGVTWVFENLTEKIDLESRYNAIVRVQSETLDNLAEGVAVFGPDGRLRLSNPAFRTLWNIPEKLIGNGDTHISELKAVCDAVAKDSTWGDFVAAVTGFDDERRDRHGRTELVDGKILNYAVVNLPNGQVMLTFVDVTDSVNVERALKERNEALEKADKLKNDFVQHVSYELRSPLTNIIGFTELLALETTGPLTQRQREYVDHIGSSSSLLLTVVNDILDLATVDAGIMELEIGEVQVRPIINAAAQLVADRLREHQITLSIETDEAPESFHADENRVRQILYNLLSNAANYAPEGGRITLSARLNGEAVEFRVHDNGPGIAPDVLASVFKRFEPRSQGGRRRGAGLGLSIVKSFVELHGGTVEIDTGPDKGTAVVCRFPLEPRAVRAAAE
ncbi:PAS-domain containing protein [Chelativorans sp. SCAU2101]|uniref:histidine kinase n=1 Tax=Chelativorans petroleitrophicus TaxID=2975484 RepID=A0A9X2X659_9HYPH|nr:PAS domain-containing sensor histidine kinase [Chelativorans petroleitrophicus]MCT8989169.1 PAS-domain containing protein [Chelativorans petroleitrophicus]